VAAEDVKEAEWDQLISQDVLIAADFWASWCPFCMKLKPESHGKEVLYYQGKDAHLQRIIESKTIKKKSRFSKLN